VLINKGRGGKSGVGNPRTKRKGGPGNQKENVPGTLGARGTHLTVRIQCNGPISTISLAQTSGKKKEKKNISSQKK